MTAPAPPAERQPTHPGEILKEDVLPALNLSIAEAARQLGISRQALHKVLAGTVAVTPEMALRLGRWCGNGPGLWLRMQQAHDLWAAERKMRAELGAIPSHAVG
ncbi:MAG: HigA family addiction module antitoxin [Sphingomonadales bacterium]